MMRLNGNVPFELAVSWNAPLPETRIMFEVAGDLGQVRWENVGDSFFRFRTVQDERVLIDKENNTPARHAACIHPRLETGIAPAVDTRVYALLDQAYACA